jgi:hypothetical protein
MMTLRSDSKLVRWAYFFSSYPPKHTTLCAFFWRAFVSIPLAWLGMGLLVTFILYVVGYGMFYQAPLASLIVTLSIIWGVIVPGNYQKTLNATLKRALDRADEMVFMQGVKAFKSKFCPIIEITRD